MLTESSWEQGMATWDPQKRGYSTQYRDGEANRCPGCGRSNWHVGRKTAECAFCGAAIPLSGER